MTGCYVFTGVCLLNFRGGGVPCPRSVGGGSTPCKVWVGGGGTPSQVWVGGYPGQVWMVGGGTPSQVWVGVPCPRSGGYPIPGLDGGGVPCPRSEGGTPARSGWWGGYLGYPPGQVWMVGGLPGVPLPPLDRVGKRALATRRAVCLLRSRRRTFFVLKGEGAVVRLQTLS